MSCVQMFIRSIDTFTMLNNCNGEQQLKKGPQLNLKELGGAVTSRGLDRTHSVAGVWGAEPPI